MEETECIADNLPTSNPRENAKEDERKEETSNNASHLDSDIPEMNETGDSAQTEEELRKEIEEKFSDEEKTDRRHEADDIKSKGNELFKSGEYKEAVEIYNEALVICPLVFSDDRAVLHSNLAACHQHLDEKEDAIEQCSKALELKTTYVKARRRRAQLYRQTEKLDEALQDYSIIYTENPDDNEARAACAMLPSEIKERNEKMKAEMIGKLKDLGNLFLRPFGLSTDNFKMQQDPNSGGYSVNFQQNSKE
uniref:Uncharacterized protein n=1 Tax=Strigamia maritima TaxID=126957 RepID=T1JG53_STRMM